MEQHIIFDFDGTITREDTIRSIAQAALHWRKTSEGGSIDLTGDWQHILQSYAQDLAAYEQTQLPEQQRITWQRELDYLEGRRVIDDASLARIREADIFTGFSADGRSFEAGRRDRETGRTRLRRGFEDYVASLKKRKISIHVVSVNWSASYVKGVLEPWSITSVIANEIQVDGSIAAPSSSLVERGYVAGQTKVLATSSDKLGAVRHLLGQVGGECLGYFGDSTTDLECLDLCGGYIMAADEGSSLTRALRRLGRDVPHVSDSPPRDGERHISWARDFAEIASCQSLRKTNNT